MQDSKTVSVQRLREILQYDPATGDISIRKSTRKLIPDEYGLVTVYDGISKTKRKIKLDKLAWMLLHGAELEKDRRILHKNLNDSDNSAKNLVALDKKDCFMVYEALNNLETYLKVQLHPTDQYKYVVSYRHFCVDRRETFDSIEAARERQEEIKKKLVLFVNKFIVSV